MKLALKKWVEEIQTAAYNGVHKLLSYNKNKYFMKSKLPNRPKPARVSDHRRTL